MARAVRKNFILARLKNETMRENLHQTSLSASAGAAVMSHPSCRRQKSLHRTAANFKGRQSRKNNCDASPAV